MKTTVIYHSADYDGIFCREIAKKFIPDAELIGWNFGDTPLAVPKEKFYILDLPLLEPFGLMTEDGWISHNNFVMTKEMRQVQPLDRIDWSNWIWIDHHKTSIEKYPKEVPGYRIDGVAACRLAWQWFNRLMKGNPREPDNSYHSRGHKWDVTCKPNRINSCDIDGCEFAPLPTKEAFINRNVDEPLSVRLAGEYDVWNKTDLRADMFQYALRIDEPVWSVLLDHSHKDCEALVGKMLIEGHCAQRYAQSIDADLVKHKSYRLKWEGLDFIVLNTGRFNSLTFTALDVPETGHDALMGYMFNGKVWTVSLYHAKHRTDIDLSEIAKKYGGGGHKGACGFTCQSLPFHS